MTAAAISLVIIHSWKQGRRGRGRRRRRRGKRRRRVGRVFSLLRCNYRVLNVFGRAAGFMRAVTSFARRGNRGKVLWGISDAEHPSCGCGLREGGGVGEQVGGGGEEWRSGGGGGGWSLLWSDRGSTRGGEGEDALSSQRHFPGTQNRTFSMRNTPIKLFYY